LPKNDFGRDCVVFVGVLIVLRNVTNKSRAVLQEAQNPYSGLGKSQSSKMSKQLWQ
jgi:hypothetical protein